MKGQKEKLHSFGYKKCLAIRLKNDVNRKIYFGTATVHRQDLKLSIVDETPPFQESQYVSLKTCQGIADV